MYWWEGGEFNWREQTVVLFHGTMVTEVDSICKRIVLERGRPRTDFGRGFYTTTSESQAIQLAMAKAEIWGTDPAVVRLEILTTRLATCSLFSFETDDAAYWEWIRRFRDPRSNAPSHGYDIVVGPVAQTWGHPPRIWRNMDQVGFHTQKAIDLLNLSQKRRII